MQAIANIIAGKVDLSWNPLSEASFYEIYMRKRGENLFTMIGSNSASKYTVGDLDNEEKYEFYIRGVNGTSSGEKSLNATVLVN